MKILIDRDSVCAADDMATHKMEFVIPENCTTFNKLFRLLDTEGYFPPIAGNEEIWAAYREDDQDLRSELFCYSRRKDKVLYGYGYSHNKIEKDKKWGMLVFRLYATPEQRAEKIFRAYRGRHYSMAHDGWFDEYYAYHISEHQEALWRQEQGFSQDQ